MRGFIKCAHQQERVKLHTHFAQRHYVAQSSPCRDSLIKPLRKYSVTYLTGEWPARASDWILPRPHQTSYNP
ncbi:uncharacterized protein M421DRAFT_258348 [Didymella exigua CBS 183.55]|uniref:Uncharacterized protein n=1 Tax=Didymella exigua CBS 183.55 TaxID=1150837 RepID=A0A6A5RCQ3_9PLEO|nr:uncharacterized protein M421DRAFT_258348 [Didymella exigua CBS 183.55]KAF1925283.1 hypothetical protein M421DRAFT_258348 [Didymella exigua CBS 183.55]